MDIPAACKSEGRLFTVQSDLYALLQEHEALSSDDKPFQAWKVMVRIEQIQDEIIRLKA